MPIYYVKTQLVLERLTLKLNRLLRSLFLKKLEIYFRFDESRSHIATQYSLEMFCIYLEHLREK